mgnify:CR=1 FL=1
MAAVVQIKNNEQEDLIETLSDALEEARAGKWSGVAMLLFERLENGHIGSSVFWAGAGSFHEKLGMIHDMADRMSASRKDV